MFKKYGMVVSMALVILQSIFILVASMYPTNLLIWNLFSISLVCGPICIIFYLIEVKNGVFREDEE